MIFCHSYHLKKFGRFLFLENPTQNTNWSPYGYVFNLLSPIPTYSLSSAMITYHNVYRPMGLSDSGGGRLRSNILQQHSEEAVKDRVLRSELSATSSPFPSYPIWDNSTRFMASNCLMVDNSVIICNGKLIVRQWITRLAYMK